MTVISTARVMTERGERYREQLASHFGNRTHTRETPATIVPAGGSGGSGGTTTPTMEPNALVMLAPADDSETLDRVKDVTGRHLERFAEKDRLVVTWA
jgi:hypothetical protein